MNPPFRAGEALAPEAYREVRLRTIFECCKWDPQVEDTSALAPYPILLPRPVHQELARLAEELALETVKTEQEILERAELLKELALPRGIWKTLAAESPSNSGPRIMRFDFHFTTGGWRISEVNSDVPGGFVEAEGFTRLMAEACSRDGQTLAPSGEPARELARALVSSSGVDKPVIALVHASAYSDDRQVVTYLGRAIEQLGGQAVLIDPSQIRWSACGQSRAQIETEWFQGEAHALFRFFPGEWLPNLKRTCAWNRFFTGAATPQCNPGWALISQSKRLGMLLPRLRANLPRWSELLPETRDVRQAPRRDDTWVFKPALGRVGDGIGLEGATSAKDWKEIRRNLFFFPGHWIAQRRFEMLPLETPDGPRFVCLGVYTLDGRACGIYARGSSSRIIDHRAQDLAVLIEPEGPRETHD